MILARLDGDFILRSYGVGFAAHNGLNADIAHSPKVPIRDIARERRD
jgi:hypothetical protein